MDEKKILFDRNNDGDLSQLEEGGRTLVGNRPNFPLVYQFTDAGTKKHIALAISSYRDNGGSWKYANEHFNTLVTELGFKDKHCTDFVMLADPNHEEIPFGKSSIFEAIQYAYDNGFTPPTPTGQMTTVTSIGEFDASLSLWETNNIGGLVSATTPTEIQPFFGKGVGIPRSIGMMAHKMKIGSTEKHFKLKLRVYNLDRNSRIQSAILKTGTLPNNPEWKEIIEEWVEPPNPDSPYWYRSLFRKFSSGIKFSDLSPTWEDDDEVLLIIQLELEGNEWSADSNSLVPHDLRANVVVDYDYSKINDSSI